MDTILESTLEPAETNYVLLRVALGLFHRPPASLNAKEQQQVLLRANRELAIGKRVLEAREAADVMVPEAVVKQAIAALEARYGNKAEFLQALKANGLDLDSLYQALKYDLKVEAVLDRVIAEEAVVSDAEAEIYYLQHVDKFKLPETRTARHILITINDTYPENRRKRALRRMSELQSQLLRDGGKFRQLAKRHSECPTAMEEGLLGRIKPGKLYPELDAALFNMQEGEISEIIESPVGMHLVLCEAVHAAEQREFDEVKDKLREHLEERKRKRLLHEWLQRAD